ncbi:MAG: hypothetical protein L0Y54_07050 [Sporichthyaceae bacterium]|nr:hypothetical protein [Sporichthyaceae bacterium]
MARLSANESVVAEPRRRTRRLARAVSVTALVAAGLLAFPTAATGQPTVLEEVGFVAFCTGEAGGYTVTADLYQNSTVEVPPVVVVELADGTVLFGVGSTEGDVFDNGSIDVDVDLVNQEDDSPAGPASVTGTYSLVGQPTRVHETLRDNGFIVVINGTNTQLDVDLSAQYAGTTIPLSCDPAFAFDLTTRRQPIGNS